MRPLLSTSNGLRVRVGALVLAAIVCGAGFGALSYRLLPPLSPAYRTRRLLALSLRDLRRLAMGRTEHDWEGLLYGRLSAMPPQATPLQFAQLLVALSAGNEIIRLRDIYRQNDHGPKLGAACAALAEGEGAAGLFEDAVASDPQQPAVAWVSDQAAGAFAGLQR